MKANKRFEADAANSPAPLKRSVELNRCAVGF